MSIFNFSEAKVTTLVDNTEIYQYTQSIYPEFRLNSPYSDLSRDREQINKDLREHRFNKSLLNHD